MYSYSPAVFTCMYTEGFTHFIKVKFLFYAYGNFVLAVLRSVMHGFDNGKRMHLILHDLLAYESPL